MYKKEILSCHLIISIMISLLFASNALCLGPLINLESFPVTGKNEYPTDSTDKLWKYSSATNNTFATFYGSGGFWNTDDLDDHPGTNEYFYLYKNSYNNEHMGWSTYAFLEIDNQFAISGNSLKITVTGGVTASGTHGLPLFHKEEYLAYLAKGQNPIANDGVKLTSDVRLYFMNESYNNQNYPLRAASGANDFRYYVYLQDGVTNKTNPQNDYNPSITMHTGPFNGTGGHWYHYFHVSGGGWVHVRQGAHPQHNNSYDNASKYPYPSLSVRNYGTDYYNSMYAIYMALGTLAPSAVPPYNVWFDNPEFIHDDYPENHETINSLAIGYYPQKNKVFEVSFLDKYKNNAYCGATYEIRYSFSQITNENFSSATPVQVQADSFYNISANTSGIIKKINNYRQQVWATFKLATTSDEDLLVAGTTIYFAIKDVSQDPNNLQAINPLYNKGRRYADYPELFDFTGDKTALPLIKRIDFFITGGPTPSQLPAAPTIKLINIK